MNVIDYLNRRAYISRGQAALAWMMTAIILGGLLACVIVVLVYFTLEKPTHEVELVANRTLIRSIFYAVACAGGQVSCGLILALGVHSVKSEFRRRALAACIVTIYCLQPFAVEDIWRRVLGFDTSSFGILIAASVWQLAPFSMLFFLAAITRVELEEPLLTSLEASSGTGRWWQIYWPSIGYTAWNIFVLRFLWMYTKFDLPYLFQEGATSSDQLIAIKIGLSARDFEQACLWAGYMIVPLLLLYISSLPLVRIARNYNIRIAMRKRGQVATQRPSWATAALSILLQLAVSVYIIPLFGAVVTYLPHLSIGRLQILKRGLFNTFVIGGAAALFAAVIGGFIAYVGGRGHSAISRLWRSSPLLGYAVPLVLLSFFVTALLPLISNACRWLSWLWYSPLHLAFDIQPATYISLTSYVTLACAAFLAFTFFSLPFTYLLLGDFIASPYHLPREQLALVDGMRAGITFQRRIVLPSHASAVLYALFFSFVINWQDISVPLQLDTAGFPFLSYQLKKLAASETLGQHSLISIGLVFSLSLGLLYFMLTPKIEALIKGSGEEELGG